MWQTRNVANRDSLIWQVLVVSVPRNHRMLILRARKLRSVHDDTAGLRLARPSDSKSPVWASLGAGLVPLQAQRSPRVGDAHRRSRTTTRTPDAHIELGAPVVTNKLCDAGLRFRWFLFCIVLGMKSLCDCAISGLLPCCILKRMWR